MERELISFVDNNAEKTLDEMIRGKMQKMLKDILEEELETFLSNIYDKKDKSGNSKVVRNGYHNERIIDTSCGPIKVKVPRTRDRSGESNNYKSILIPSYKKRTLNLEEAISYLYLKGISTNQMHGVLTKIYGANINLISPGSVTALVRKWKEEQDIWDKRDLSRKEYCYIWVDGIHFNIRNSEDRACFYVIMGATKEGRKEIIAIDNGYRESKDSWEVLLRNLKARGMMPPKLAIGDGALGFWAALKNIYPETREQLCWVHKTANILDKLPKKLQDKAKKSIQQIYLAETKNDAKEALNIFYKTYQDKYPRATNCLKNVEQRLLTFYDYPAIHWQHIRTTNPIESTFSSVRLRTKSTRGNCNLETTKVMVYKLITEAEKNWKALKGAKLVAKVFSGTKFIDGIEEKVA